MMPDLVERLRRMKCGAWRMSASETRVAVPVGIFSLTIDEAIELAEARLPSLEEVLEAIEAKLGMLRTISDVGGPHEGAISAEARRRLVEASQSMLELFSRVSREKHAFLCMFREGCAHGDLCFTKCEHAIIVAAMCEHQTGDPNTEFRDKVADLVMASFRRQTGENR